MDYPSLHVSFIFLHSESIKSHLSIDAVMNNVVNLYLRDWGREEPYLEKLTTEVFIKFKTKTKREESHSCFQQGNIYTLFLVSVNAACNSYEKFSDISLLD